ncbi:MAG: AraC family transcriptional regulator [Gemmataceae bacterium]
MAADELARLIAAIERHAPADGAYHTAIHPLRLYRASAPTDLNTFVYEPALCIVAQGSKEVRLGAETYRHDPARTLLVSVDLPVSARVVRATSSHPCLMVRITLDPSVVGELLADCPHHPPQGPPGRGLDVCPVEVPLLDAVARFVALLDSPHAFALLAPLVLREIIFRLLLGRHGPRLRQIATAGAPAQRIARAIRWLKEHFAESLRVESLARQARMSLSGFHQHFKSVTGLSPLQYQKRLRLHEARRLMLGDRLDAGEAAFRVGYESPSQFSREYRRMFGESPRRDVAALRGG